MLRAIGFLIKTAIFAAIVLVLGNWVHWKGRTVSDQVKTELAHAEKSEIVTNVRDWTHDVHPTRKTRIGRIASPGMDESEQISTTERQRLRALIRELNYNASDR